MTHLKINSFLIINAYSNAITVPKEFEMIPLSRKSLKHPYTKNNVITAQNGIKSPLVPLKVCLSQKEFEIDNKSMPLQF